jgi:hypothetical protein
VLEWSVDAFFLAERLQLVDEEVGVRRGDHERVGKK